MKFKSFIGVGLMLATGLAFIGCSSDNAPDGPDKVLNAGTTFYVRVAVSNTDGTGTRANAREKTTISVTIQMELLPRTRSEKFFSYFMMRKATMSQTVNLTNLRLLLQVAI